MNKLKLTITFLATTIGMIGCHEVPTSAFGTLSKMKHKEDKSHKFPPKRTIIETYNQSRTIINHWLKNDFDKVIGCEIENLISDYTSFVPYYTIKDHSACDEKGYRTGMIIFQDMHYPKLRIHPAFPSIIRALQDYHKQGIHEQKIKDQDGCTYHVSIEKLDGIQYNTQNIFTRKMYRQHEKSNSKYTWYCEGTYKGELLRMHSNPKIELSYLKGERSALGGNNHVYYFGTALVILKNLKTNEITELLI